MMDREDFTILVAVLLTIAGVAAAIHHHLPWSLFQ